MDKKQYVLGIDAGGTYFKCALVDKNGKILLGSQEKCRIDANGSIESVLEGYVSIIREAKALVAKENAELTGIGVSTPGPFDYDNHTSLMTHKFKSIYGIDLLQALKNRYPVGDIPVLFLCDAHAFLLGEFYAGAAKGFQNAAGVTLGTGIGLAVIRDGKLLMNEKKGPFRTIYRDPCRGGVAEDFLSHGGILRMYAEISGKEPPLEVRDVELLALEGHDQAAYEIFARTGEILAEILAGVLTEMKTECLILGGQIAKGFPLMEKRLRDGLSGIPSLTKITRAENIDCAAQIGAATEAFRQLGYSQLSPSVV